MHTGKLTALVSPMLGLAAIVFAGPAQSQTLITSPGALGTTDSIDWGQLGPTFTQLTTAQNWTSTMGATGQVGIDGSTLGTTNMERRDEANGWGGNFSPGDHLLWNQNTTSGNGDIGLIFASAPVAGVGSYIQSDAFGAFTANVTAFLQGGGAESFTEAGTSNGNNDGSAIFIGILDPTPDIAFFTFGVTDTNGANTVAIDTVLFTTNISSPGTPEPGSLALFAGAAITGLGLLRRRRSIK